MLLLLACRVTGVRSVTWPSVALDSISLVLLAVALYAQTATVVAVDRYWERHCKVTDKVGTSRHQLSVKTAQSYRRADPRLSVSHPSNPNL